MFQAPNSAGLYIDRILERSDFLISAGIWSGISRRDLGLWFDSYNSIEERYLAALMLDNLTLRSRGQTKSLMLQCFQRVLPKLLEGTYGFEPYRGKWLESLQKRKVKVRLVPVIREEDGPHKSANAICRDYAMLHSIHGNLFIDAVKIESALDDGVKLFIFVDDFVGTGTQFLKFYKSVEPLFPDDVVLCYLPLCAHQAGLTQINNCYPRVKISAPEILTYKDAFFKDDNQPLTDNLNTYADLKEFYLNLQNDRLGEEIENPLGYGDLSLVYGFENATPNATLPLLWSSKNNNTILLKRS